jgi:hypothetical protein
MVRISGTLSNGVSMSGRMFGQNAHTPQQQVKPVEETGRPVALKDQQPDMTFSGIGRTVDINV